MFKRFYKKVSTFFKSFTANVKKKLVVSKSVQEKLDLIKANEITELKINEPLSKIEFKKLIKELSKNTSINSFDFTKAINSDGDSTNRIKDILEAISNNNVTELSFSDNDLGDDDMLLIAEYVDGNESLTSLDISNNNMSEEGSRALGQAIRENNSLTSLNLDGSINGCSSWMDMISYLTILNNLIQTSIELDKFTFNGAQKSLSIVTSLIYYIATMIDTGVKGEIIEGLKDNYSLTSVSGLEHNEYALTIMARNQNIKNQIESLSRDYTSASEIQFDEEDEVDMEIIKAVLHKGARFKISTDEETNDAFNAQLNAAARGVDLDSIEEDSSYFIANLCNNLMELFGNFTSNLKVNVSDFVQIPSYANNLTELVNFITKNISVIVSNAFKDTLNAELQLKGDGKLLTANYHRKDSAQQDVQEEYDSSEDEYETREILDNQVSPVPFSCQLDSCELESADTDLIGDGDGQAIEFAVAY